MNRLDRNIMVSEIKRFIKILKPENTYSVARAIARKEIYDAQRVVTGAEEFSTEDATPYEIDITIPGTYSIGQLEYSVSIALSDGSESAFYRGFVTFRNEDGTAAVIDTVDLLAWTSAGSLSGTSSSVSMSADVLTISFTGVAATDIEGRITYSVESRTISGPVLP